MGQQTDQSGQVPPPAAVGGKDMNAWMMVMMAGVNCDQALIKLMNGVGEDVELQSKAAQAYITSSEQHLNDLANAVTTAAGKANNSSGVTAAETAYNVASTIVNQATQQAGSDGQKVAQTQQGLTQAESDAAQLLTALQTLYQNDVSMIQGWSP